jgi:hypothetical protein
MFDDQDDYRELGWSHGSLTVQRLGAMMAPVTFVLGDGRRINPMHIAPWADDPGTSELPGILRRLRGEWPCVPFGYTVPPDGFSPDWTAVSGTAAPDEEAHGHSANNDWSWGEGKEGSLCLTLDYPDTSDVRRVERRIIPDPNAPAVDIEFTVHVRQRCRLPIGLHPVFRLPTADGAAELKPGRFGRGLTHPGTVEPGATLFAKNASFTNLTEVPRRNGGKVDASRLPLSEDIEDLLQLNDVDGRFFLNNHAENYRVSLSWNPADFPSVLLWYSNRGRKAAPWDGRHVAIGIEPICSPFGLGPTTALADNPIAAAGTPTALDFDPDEPFVTRYRIEAEPL